MSTSVGSIHYDLNLDTKNFDKEVSKLTGKLKSVGKDLQSVGKKMSLFVTTPILASGAAAIKSAGDYEQLQVAFETMLGSADKARKLLKELDDLAVTTPFSITDVQDAGRQMLAYGIEADKVVETTRMLGDVSAGLGIHTFPQLTLAFGQIKAKGKLMGQELLQLTNAGFDLAGAMGITRGELMELMETEEGVTFEQVEEAFKRTTSEGGRFHNMMQNQSKTTMGRISNLKDEITRLLRDLGTIMLPTINRLVNVFSAWAEKIRSLSPEQQKMIVIIALVVAAIGPLLLILGTLIITIGAIASPIGLVVVGITALIAAIVTVITWLGLWDETFKVLKVTFDLIRATIQAVIQVIQFAINVLRAIYNVVSAVVIPVFRVLISVFSGPVVGAINTVIFFLNKVIATFRMLQVAVGRVKGWLADFGNVIKGLFNGASTWLYQIGKSIINGLWNGMKSAWRNVKGWVGGLGGQIKNLKGPIEKDKVMLVNEGNAIMQGLNKGLTHGYRDVLRTIVGVNSSLQSNMTPKMGNMQTSTSIYGNINIGNQQQADSFFSRLTRNQELTSIGLASKPGSL